MMDVVLPCKQEQGLEFSLLSILQIHLYHLNIGYFVSTYYHTLTYDPASLVNYYAKDAQLWRDSFSSDISHELKENEEYFPRLKTTDSLAILNYRGLVIPGGINIIVDGILKTETEQKLNYLYNDDSMIAVFGDNDKPNQIETLFSRYEEYALYMGLEFNESNTEYAKIFIRADTKRTIIKNIRKEGV